MPEPSQGESTNGIRNLNLKTDLDLLMVDACEQLAIYAQSVGGKGD
ncbi:MAG: hypothetical protein AB8B99_10140 [Phormidesmis sp.]